MRKKAFHLLMLLALTACSQEPKGVLQGYAEGEYVRVASPFSGNLAQLAVQRGAQAAVGTPLFTLEQQSESAARREAEERLRRAEAQLDNLKKGRRPAELDAIRAQHEQALAAMRLAQHDFARNRQLAASGFLSAQKLDSSRSILQQSQARTAELVAQLASAKLAARSDEIRAAEADVKTAQAVLAQAVWRLQQKTVASTVNGLVQDTLYTQGEWVPAGSPVIVLLPPENIKVRFFVTQKQIGSLRIGQSVSLSCDGCGPAISARIGYLAPQAEYTPPVIYSKENRDKLMFLAEARPAPADAVKLHPGQPVDVKIAP